MPKPRYAQISAEETPYVHVVSRTVRRSFLCGDDKYSGKNYDHRRQWLEEEILRLAGVFSLDVAAYAVMSNHFHIILFIDTATVKVWSDDEVIERWHELFKGSLQSQQYMAGEVLDKSQSELLNKQVIEWRSRLKSEESDYTSIKQRIKHFAQFAQTPAIRHSLSWTNPIA